MAGSGTAQLRSDDMLLRVEHLVVEFGKGARRIQAVSDVSFDVAAGETLGLVGESGCGKSTTGRAAALVHPPNSGSVRFAGTELTALGSPRSASGPDQGPDGLPGPDLLVESPATGPRLGHGAPGHLGHRHPERTAGQGRRRRSSRSASTPSDAGGRRPIEFSGGQCQRISIARALMLEPTLLICDEPVSALDVSVQAQILNLLDDLKRQRGLTMVFIAHDLAVVKNVSDRVAVMYLGKLCEVSPPDTLYRHPAHPYTAALLASIPEPDPAAAGNGSAPLAGELPSPADPPSGCRFRTRCPYAQDRCAEEEPADAGARPRPFRGLPLPPGPAGRGTPVGRRSSTGCVLGPLIAYRSRHENRFRRRCAALRQIGLRD